MAASAPVSLPPFLWEDQTVESIREECKKIIQETKDLSDSIAGLEGELTFENCVAPLMSPPNYKTNPRLCQTKFLQHCSTDPAIREAANEAGIQFAKTRIAQRMDARIYAKVKQFSTTSEASKLSTYEKHFLQSIIKDFERSGLGLEEEKRTRLVQLLESDAETCAAYGANISNESTKLSFTKEELEGVNASFIDAHTTPQGNCAISLKYPDILPILQTCVIASTREKITRTRGSVYGNNLELFVKGIQLRKEIAYLLGYDTFAEYITSNRMVGNSTIVTEFLDELQEKAKVPGQKELARLLACKKSHLESRNESFDGKINAWDYSFYHELLMRNEYGVNDDVIKTYFPVHHVVAETLSIYEDLLSLSFKEVKSGFQKWHKDVRLFNVFDNVPGSTVDTLIGQFYLDLHPRDGKYSHAAIFHILKQHGEQVPVDCMLTNLPAAVGDQPALLTHDDVVTFFHEFGHIMHGLCSEGEANNTHLAKCPRDFVEAPSQMLENWCWKPEVLEKLSKHHVTGETLPNDLLAKLLAAKNVNCALGTLRQIYLSSLDIHIHSNPPSTEEELQKIASDMKLQISLIESPPNCTILRSFGHLMNQYAASYYGYLWSEVISADMFHTRFASEGIFNVQTGMDYRKQILAPGGVGSIMEQVTKFLGRPPNQEHFLSSRGMK